MAEVANPTDSDDGEIQKRQLAAFVGPCRRVAMNMLINSRTLCSSSRSKSTATKVIAALAMLMLPIAMLSRDRVPIGHLDLARAYYDRRDVLVSRWAELPVGLPGHNPPTFTPAQKERLGKWRNFDGNACTPVADTPLVWTLKTPKAASSTLQDLILSLHSAHPNRFVVNTRQLRVDPTKIPAKRSEMLQRYAEYFSHTLSRRTVYTAHGWFIDLELESDPSIQANTAVQAEAALESKGSAVLPVNAEPPQPSPWWPARFLESVVPFPLPFTVRYRPVCVGTLRDPLKRLVSHYEYLQLGPRSVWSVARHGRPTAPTSTASAAAKSSSNWFGGWGAGSSSSSSSSAVGGGGVGGHVDFPSCMAQHLELLKQGEQGLAADPLKCAHWAGVQLRYFCGYHDFETCQEAGVAALEIALGNVEKHFLVVVMVEQFEQSLQLLETLLPSVFQGIGKLYHEQGSSRVNTHHIDPPPASPSSPASAHPQRGRHRHRQRRLLRDSSHHSSSSLVSSRGAPVVAPNNASSSFSPSTPRARAPLGSRVVQKPAPRRNPSPFENTEVPPHWPPEVAEYVLEKLHFEQVFYNRMAQRLKRQLSVCFP